jgi:hypothetical protein
LLKSNVAPKVKILQLFSTLFPVSNNLAFRHPVGRCGMLLLLMMPLPLTQNGSHLDILALGSILQLSFLTNR